VQCISGWNDSYSEAEKRTIIDSLPPSYRKYDLDNNGRLICPISVDFVLNDTHLKNAVAKFKKDVGEGFCEKAWQNQGRRAMQERRDGKFDAYLKESMEATFGEDGHDDMVVDTNDQAEDEAASSDGEWSEKKGKGKRKVHLQTTQVLRQKRKG